MDKIMTWDENFQIPNRSEFILVYYFRKLRFALCKKNIAGEYWAVNELGERTSNIYHPENPTFEDTYGDNKIGIVRIESKGKYGLLGKGGVEITPCIYEKSIWFKDDCDFAVVIKDGKKALLGTNGKEISKFYDINNSQISSNDIHFYDSGLAKVSQNGKWGILRNDGIEILPCQYDNISWLFNHKGYENHAVVGQGNKKAIFLKKELKLSAFYDWSDSINKIINDKLEIHFGFNENGLAAVSQNGKWGILRNDGIEIQSCIFEEYISFSKHSQYIHVSSSGKYGLLNQNGETVIDFKYSSNIYFKDFKGEKIAPVSIKIEGCGIINEKGEQIVPCIYDGGFDDEYYWEGVRAYKLNGKYVILKDLKRTSELEYDNYDGDWVNGFRDVYRDEKFGFINSDGIEIVPCKYGDVWDFGEGEDGLAQVVIKGKWGIINKSGIEVIPPIFDEIDWVFWEKPLKARIAIVRADSKFGLIDTLNSKEILPVEYSSIKFNEENQFFVAKKDDFIRVLDLEFNDLIEQNRFTEIETIKEDKFPIKGYLIREKMGYGLMDKNFKVLIPGKYDYRITYSTYQDSIEVFKTQKDQSRLYGLYSIDGIELVPCKYLEIDKRYGLKLMIARDETGNVLYNDKGILITNKVYELIHLLSNSICRAKIKDGGYGCLNNEGNEITSFNYSHIDWRKEETLSVADQANNLIPNSYIIVKSKEYKYGIIDIKGNLIIPCLYDTIEVFHEGLSIVSLKVSVETKSFLSKKKEIQTLFGFVDKNGTQVIKPKYQKAGNFVNGKSEVILNGHKGYIDFKGNEFWV